MPAARSSLKFSRGEQEKRSKAAPLRRISGFRIAGPTTEGQFFAREAQRDTRAGRSLAKVAGAAAVRSGKLSSD